MGDGTELMLILLSCGTGLYLYRKIFLFLDDNNEASYLQSILSLAKGNLWYVYVCLYSAEQSMWY